MIECLLLMPRFSSHTLFLGLFSALLAFNVFSWTSQTVTRLNNPNLVGFHTLGFKFMGLEKIFPDQRTVGYYTDKNLDIPLAIAQFEQAQYMLSPTVLELNNTRHRFVIFDCTSPQTAVNKIKELGLVPLKANNDGIILAVNPQAP